MSEKLDQIKALRVARAERNSSRGQRAPKQPGAALPVSTETASDKGKAKNGPAVRRRAAKPGALAPAKGTTQRADRAAPAVPRGPKPRRATKAKVPGKTSTKTPKVKTGRPRVEDIGKTLSDTKPWLSAKPPMSRASWYRRKAKP